MGYFRKFPFNQVNFLCVLIFLLGLLEHGNCANGADNITKVLNELNKKPYDKRIRPFYGENPLVIKISFNLESIVNIDENNREITLKLTLVQRWFETRLTFTPGLLPNDTLKLGLDQAKLLWMPDTIVTNQRRAEKIDGHELVVLSSEGLVTFSQTSLTTVDFFMDFNYFPFDIQTVQVKFSSYSSDIKDMVYEWNIEASSMVSNIISNRFQLVSFDTLSRIEQNQKASLVLRLHLTAHWQKYLAIFFYPIILFTLVSLISLWISTTSPRIGVLIDLLNVTLLNLFLVTLGTGKEVHISGTAIGQYLTLCLVTSFCCLFVNFGKLYLELNPIEIDQDDKQRKKRIPVRSDIEELTVEEVEEGDSGTEKNLEYFLKKAKHYFQMGCNHAYWILLIGFILLNFFYWGAHLNSQESRLARLVGKKV